MEQLPKGDTVREVDRSENDGITKVMWWDQARDQAFITVADAKNPKNNFAFELTPEMNPLEEFKHALSRNPHEIGRTAIYATPEEMK